ncbi:hypothetical protein BN59_01339 [Legionella massiliensis]|uniref:Uncharacterized protein n=1 Tax=Legionella massiliensis TaxID=1034943 RepID=A0A078KRL1_9GAMM|nr:hypothetical protein [Legionella massiliensis]CDZ77060.1 hypothetical protein BN59_01339 [Legionella massiliensis]CEE12798.1 hypothetical protein BN1094_01339 [Legionella massiliensis]
MTRELKEILVKIAGMPKADQRWILNKLPEQQKTLFKQMQGEQELANARRFSKLPKRTEPLQLAPKVPAYPQSLSPYPSLYIAIVLEQGQFSWQESFLQAVDQEGSIKRLMSKELHALKEAPKQALFKQWQKESSFHTFLEQSND